MSYCGGCAGAWVVLTMASGLVNAKYTAWIHKTATYIESSTTHVRKCMNAGYVR